MRRRFVEIKRNSNSELIEAVLSSFTFLEMATSKKDTSFMRPEFSETRENLEELRRRVQHAEEAAR